MLFIPRKCFSENFNWMRLKSFNFKKGKISFSHSFKNRYKPPKETTRVKEINAFPKICHCMFFPEFLLWCLLHKILTKIKFVKSVVVVYLLVFVVFQFASILCCRRQNGKKSCYKFVLDIFQTFNAKFE
jgi:hypothetical protein